MAPDSTACCSTRRAPTSARSNRVLTCAGARILRSWSGLRSNRPSCSRPPRGRSGPAVCSSTRRAPSPPARMRSACAPSWTPAPTSTARGPCSCCRTATAPTGSTSRGWSELRERRARVDRRTRRERPAALSRLRRAVAATFEPAGPLPLRLLPAPLRAALGLPELRRPLDDRADVGHGERRVPQLRRVDADADLGGASDPALRAALGGGRRVPRLAGHGEDALARAFAGLFWALWVIKKSIEAGRIDMTVPIAQFSVLSH